VAVKNFIIFHFPFVICHLSFVICHLSFVICHCRNRSAGRGVEIISQRLSARASSNEDIPRCWAHRCPGGTRCLQGPPFFVRAPHMTRSTASGFGSGFCAVTVSRADTAGIEAPAFGSASGACPFGPGASVLFNAKTARVPQSSSPATDLK
jgi:hypothetical protein